MNELESEVTEKENPWKFTPSGPLGVRIRNYMKMAGIKTKAEFMQQCVVWFLQDNERRMFKRYLDNQAG